MTKIINNMIALFFILNVLGFTHANDYDDCINEFTDLKLVFFDDIDGVTKSTSNWRDIVKQYVNGTKTSDGVYINKYIKSGSSRAPADYCNYL